MTTTATPALTHSDPNSPAWRSQLYRELRGLWDMMRDVMTGTRAIRANASTYAPRYELETEGDWKSRIGRTETFPALKRTVAGLSGMVFRENPQLGDDAPEQLEKDWENIDGAGTHADVFGRRLFEDGLLTGGGGILVEAPVSEAGATMGDEKRAGVRPYWCAIPAEQVINVQWATVDGRPVCTLLVLEEPSNEPDGQFGVKPLTRYRVMRRSKEGRVTFETYVSRDGGEPAPENQPKPITNQTEIPYAPLDLSEQPPLLELAYAQLAHFNVRSDRRAALRKQCMAILVRSGVDDDSKPIIVSPNKGVDLPPAGKLEYVEPKGEGLDQVRTELEDLKNEMAAQGLAMLQRDTRSAETAEAKRLDKGEQDCQLARYARALNDCLERANQFHMNYYGEKDAGGSVNVNMDFDGLALEPEMIAQYLAMVTAGKMSVQTMWQIMQEKGALPDDFDPEKEKVAIEKAGLEDDERAVRQTAAIAEATAVAAGESEE